MKKNLLVALLALCTLSFTSFGAYAANSVDVVVSCGSHDISGSIETSLSQEIAVTATVSSNTGFEEITSYSITTQSDEEIAIKIDPTQYAMGLYNVEIVARAGDKLSQWNYKTFLGGEECDSLRDVQKRIVQYADEARNYFDNVEEEQKLPAKFLATGLGSWIDDTIQGTSQRFSYANKTTYHNVPEWTVGPFEHTYPSFKEQYAFLPDEYRDAQAYLSFKGLLVPIVLPSYDTSDAALLNALHTGMVLAPETPELSSIGNVKMLYSHSQSFINSPFSGVGSYLSLYSNPGDTVEIYVKKGYVSYDKRTYTINHKIQILPEQTEIIKNFKQDGKDSFALITCKSGDVLGSTKAREVLLLNRVSHELGGFQKTMIQIHDVPTLAEQAAQFNSYLARKDLDDEAVAILVKELERAEKDGENPLHMISTYGKYMASYDAIYN